MHCDEVMLTGWVGGWGGKLCVCIGSVPPAFFSISGSGLEQMPTHTHPHQLESAVTILNSTVLARSEIQDKMQ